MQQKERNQTFNYIYAFVILAVIDEHVSARIGVLTSIFPYNSFFMPLLVFASGYFFKKASILKFSCHKAKKLMFPYLIWNAVALLLAFCLDTIFHIDWCPDISLLVIAKVFFYGPATSLIGATWFVPMLFWVSILYNVIRHVFKDSKISDGILTALLLILGFISVYLCTQGYYKNGTRWVVILRTVFYLQFYHLGGMFRKYWEKPLLRCRKSLVCCICILINIVLILKYGSSINFPSTGPMRGFSIWYLPLITSATATVFYYEIAEYLGRKIGQHPIVDFFAQNSATIMEAHLIFTNIPNFWVYYQIQNGSTNYPDFKVASFSASAWYRYSTDTRLIGFVCGVVGCCLLILIMKKVRTFFTDRLNPATK